MNPFPMNGLYDLISSKRRGSKSRRSASSGPSRHRSSIWEPSARVSPPRKVGKERKSNPFAKRPAPMRRVSPTLTARKSSYGSAFFNPFSSRFGRKSSTSKPVRAKVPTRVEDPDDRRLRSHPLTPHEIQFYRDQQPTTTRRSSIGGFPPPRREASLLNLREAPSRPQRPNAVNPIPNRFMDSTIDETEDREFGNIRVQHGRPIPLHRAAVRRNGPASPIFNVRHMPAPRQRSNRVNAQLPSWLQPQSGLDRDGREFNDAIFYRDAISTGRGRRSPLRAASHVARGRSPAVEPIYGNIPIMLGSPRPRTPHSQQRVIDEFCSPRATTRAPSPSGWFANKSRKPVAEPGLLLPRTTYKKPAPRSAARRGSPSPYNLRANPTCRDSVSSMSNYSVATDGRRNSQIRVDLANAPPLPTRRGTGARSSSRYSAVRSNPFQENRAAREQAELFEQYRARQIHGDEGWKYKDWHSGNGGMF